MLSWIWLIIGLIFYYFSIVFFQYSRTPLQSFVIRKGHKNTLEGAPEIEELSSFKELLSDVDRYLESINSRNLSRARIAAIGFFLAGLASFIAAYIS